MGKQSSLFPFTGKLGNVIGYQRNGQYFLRSMPEIVRQTVATRRAARRFGMASKKGALLRNAFYDDLDIRCDSSHINRLTRVLIGAAGNNTALAGFRFNRYAGIDRFFAVAPRLLGNGILHIPPQTLAQHKGITALEVKVIAARIDFITCEVIGTETSMVTIDPRAFFEGADISLDVPGEGTLVITLQVIGMQKDFPSSNRQYFAADIVAVEIPQEPKVFNKPGYPQAGLTPETASNPVYSYAYLPVVQRE
jgi:hypothetical protein